MIASFCYSDFNDCIISSAWMSNIYTECSCIPLDISLQCKLHFNIWQNDRKCKWQKVHIYINSSWQQYSYSSGTEKIVWDAIEDISLKDIVNLSFLLLEIHSADFSTSLMHIFFTEQLHGGMRKRGSYNSDYLIEYYILKQLEGRACN